MEINFCRAQNFDAPCSIVVVEHLVPVMEGLWSQKFRQLR